jgi:hypothetical protein
MSKSIHSERLKAIRQYVSFNYDLRKPLSSYEKRKIKRYYDAISETLANPGQIQRHAPRRKDHLETARKSLGLDSLSEIRAVPIVMPERARVSYRGKKMILKTQHVTREFLPIPPPQIVADLPGVIKKVKREFPRAKRVSIGTDAFETKASASIGQLSNFITDLQTRYKETFSKWFRGVYVYEFQNQSDFDEYTNRKIEARAARDKRTARKSKAKQRAKRK